MITQLMRQREGQPWMVGGVLSEVAHLMDEDGRPIGERRASSAAKHGVTIELKPCPYNDQRSGRAMNVSALMQITSHLSEVRLEIAQFQPGATKTGWQAMFRRIIDQYAGPARCLLLSHEEELIISGQVSVGHKLAAGYFSAIKLVLAREACGEEVTPCPEVFLNLISADNLLIGASEVCAGPMPLIRSLTELFLSPPQLAINEDNLRTPFADELATQIQLGICWELFDLACEKKLLVEHKALHGERITRNAFIEEALNSRSAELTQQRPLSSYQPKLPQNENDTDLVLETMLRAGAPSQPPTLAFQLLNQRLTEQAGVLSYESANFSQLASTLHHYLAVMRAFGDCMWTRETTLRELFDFNSTQGLGLHSAIFPRPRSLRWFEALLGYRIELGAAPHGSIFLKRPNEVIPLNTDSWIHR